MEVYRIRAEKWAECLSEVIREFQVFGPVKKESYSDFEIITDEKIGSIHYEGNTPITPQKAFFFPVKENATLRRPKQQRIILGVPNCDLAALDLMDNIYLKGDFVDPCYKANREVSIVFGKDCTEIKESCHCTAYGLKPYSEKNCDVSMSVEGGSFFFTPMSEKGISFLQKYVIPKCEVIDSLPAAVTQKREGMVGNLQKQNKEIPDEKESRKGIEKENPELWKKHASTCVSCGACSLICPTCHCFLLVDMKDFEKVKNWDVCQLPGFSRVAAGGDHLEKLFERLQYRFLCKFVYKPDMFKAIACTGCGRCIDSCIGKISKNEVIVEACRQG